MGGELQALDLSDGQHHDCNLDEGFDDGHREPEREVDSVEVGGGATREEGADRMPGVADLNDEGCDKPC